MAPNKVHMTTPNAVVNFVDKRRATSVAADSATHTVAKSIAPFTCNATGSTTTAVGANAAPGTNDNNIARRGEKFQIFNAAGAKKEETIFTVSGIAVAGSTTLTFSPAAATAPVNTDVLRWVGISDYDDIADIQARLVALSYTDAQINSMTLNDMQFAIRQADNADGI